MVEVRTGASIGRSAQCGVVLSDRDVTVSGVHARLHATPSGWEVEDADSKTGTFVASRRLAAGERTPLAPGDWILFGAAGVAARVLAEGAAPPRAWVVVETDGRPGAFAAAADVEEARLAVDGEGHPCADASPEARSGLRVRLDRTPPTAAPLDAADAPGVAVASGEVLRFGRERTGLRVLAVRSATFAGAPGTATVVGALRREIGRQRRVAWTVGVLLMIGLAGAGYLVLREARQDDEDARRRLDEQRARLELEVEADRDRVKRSIDLLDERFAQSLETVQARLAEKLDSSRQEMDAELERQRRATEADLAKLAQNERERFGALLDRYRASVLLLYVVVRYPGIRRSNGEVLRQAFYGTGWVARADGLVVTNKHVAEPWKFDAEIQALLASAAGSRIETEFYAWPAGARFVGTDGRVPDPTSGYNSTSLASLRFVGSAPDEWAPAVAEFGGRTVRSRTHAPSDGDLAVLRISGGPFTPLPLKVDPTTLKSLAPLMLLGFPLGGSILAQGRAELSATLGTLNFVGETVTHSAPAFHGNSGGPLCALDGEVVGVLTRGPGETLNMAIRSDTVRRFLERWP